MEKHINLLFTKPYFTHIKKCSDKMQTHILYKLQTIIWIIEKYKQMIKLHQHKLSTQHQRLTLC